MADFGGFDVLETMDGLKASGFSDAQARALADSFQQAVAARQGELVTKGDLKATEAVLRQELKASEAVLRQELAELRTELKGDIAELCIELKGDIVDLRIYIDQRIDRLRDDVRDQQRWTVGILLTGMGVLFAANAGLIAFIKFH